MNTKPQELTNQEVLTKVIQKAIDGGWTQLAQFFEDNDWTLEIHDDNGFLSRDIGNHETWKFSVNDITFNHDFAKALWGETPEVCDCECYGGPEYFDNGEIPAWQYHLQQMVVAEDPIKYLGDNT